MRMCCACVIIMTSPRSCSGWYEVKGTDSQNSFAIAMYYIVFVTCALVMLYNAYVAARYSLECVVWEGVWVMVILCE